MKKALLLFAALLVAGCGEKSSSEGSESASENPTAPNQTGEPSADTAKQSPAEPPVAESPSEEPSDTPNSLSDADVVRLLKDAVEIDSLEERDDLFYQNNPLLSVVFWSCGEPAESVQDAVDAIEAAKKELRPSQIANNANAKVIAATFRPIPQRVLHHQPSQSSSPTLSRPISCIPMPRPLLAHSPQFRYLCR